MYRVSPPWSHKLRGALRVPHEEQIFSRGTRKRLYFDRGTRRSSTGPPSEKKKGIEETVRRY